MEPSLLDFALSTALPAEIRGARNEFAELPLGVPDRWIFGWPFRGIVSHFRGSDDTPVPGAFVGESLTLSNRGRALVRGIDIEVDDYWGTATRLHHIAGAILANYEFRMLRIDALVQSNAGVRSLIRGRSHLSTPLPPKVPDGDRHLANVFIPYRGPAQLLPLGVADPRTITANQIHLLPHAASRLKSGSVLRVTCWGDSVTVGGSSTSRWSAFPNLVETYLQRAGHPVAVTTVATGGTNTSQWLTSSSPWTQLQDVRNSQPDLLVVEFVNDAELPTGSWPDHYGEIVAQADEWGCDVLLMTPHFTRPDWMGHASMDSPDTRPYVAFLRDFSVANGTALADASRAWERLWSEGLPYLTLLKNGINHPDDRGHAIYAREICAALGVTIPVATDQHKLDMRG